MMPATPSPTPAPEPRFGRQWWLLPCGAVLLLLLYAVPHALTAHLSASPLARLTLENQLRDVGAKVLWAGLSFVGATLIWRYLQQLAKIVENSAQTLAAAERTAFFAAQAAETERYGRAMALLGDDKIEVRLGGVYTLERLARESERDHGPIMQVLAAFARERAGWSEGEVVPARISADLQAILTVIGRRHAAFDRAETRIDLHGTSLARAYLPYAHLEGAFLYESNLDGAMLQGANLRGAWCWKSSFAGATLEGAHLEGADLTGAAGLTLEQIHSAHRDAATKLPPHVSNQLEASDSPRDSPDSQRSENEQNLKLPTRRASF